MTLLISVFAAVIATVIWYVNDTAKVIKVSMLMYMFWGASLMWLVDAIAEYMEMGAEYFTPAPADMLNDSFLGLSVVALALIIWIVRVLITDPLGMLQRNRKESLSECNN